MLSRSEKIDHSSSDLKLNRIPLLEIMNEARLSARTVAETLGVAIRTVQHWRHRSRGPDIPTKHLRTLQERWAYDRPTNDEPSFSAFCTAINELNIHPFGVTDCGGYNPNGDQLHEVQTRLRDYGFVATQAEICSFLLMAQANMHSRLNRDALTNEKVSF